MYSEDTETSITITVDQGLICLLLPEQWNEGKQVRLALGLPDTLEGKSQAQLIVQQIELDYAKGQLKEWEHYQKANNKPEVAVEVSSNLEIEFLSLWDEFINFYRTQIEETSLIFTYKRARNHIIKNPYKLLSQASEMLNYLIDSTSPAIAKRILMFWNKSCNWAVSTNKIPSNPFHGMKDLIVIPSNNSKLEITEDSGYNSIDPFSEAEAKVILQAFENHHKYSHYKPLVHFLFLTGCRTSEAIGL